MRGVSDPDGDRLSYRSAGVDIDRANRLVERIKPIAARTRRPEVLAGVGGFGALCTLPGGRYREPVLVSGTDGVGTKLRLAIDSRMHDTIGVDLVAMCANDVLAHGAEPLYFLDYFATGRVDVDVAEAVLAGVGRGCELAGAALVGGETAEMPGMYADGDYDLAGFCVGVVERERLVDGRAARPGDRLLGLASSGAHANGYSLIRRVIERSGVDLDAPFEGGASLRRRLLEPTRVYVRAVLEVLARCPVHGIAHITGGGLPENLPRALPPGTGARVRGDAWPRPALFDWIQRAGAIDEAEMRRTFNCGVGLVMVVPPEHAERALSVLHDAGEQAWIIGEAVAADAHAPRVAFE